MRSKLQLVVGPVLFYLVVTARVYFCSQSISTWAIEVDSKAERNETGMPTGIHNTRRLSFRRPLLRAVVNKKERKNRDDNKHARRH